MSAGSSYVWQSTETNAFCAPQNVVAGTALIFNGTIPTKSKDYIAPRFVGVSRTVTVTTNFALGGIVTITGTYLGKPQSAQIAGPNNTTSETLVYFDSITSVKTTTNAAGGNTIAIGSGKTGHTHWFMIDSYRPFMSLSVDMTVTSGGGGALDYTFVSTQKDPVNTPLDEINISSRKGIVGPDPGGANPFAIHMVNATASAVACLTTPALYACIVVNISNANDSFNVSFLQQGIK